MIDSLFHAIDLVSWPAILWLAVGMLFGIFVGALPVSARTWGWRSCFH